MRRSHLSLALAGAIALVASAASAQEINWGKVDETLGRKAQVTGDVHRYGFPRTDLNVTLDGVTIKPGLALGGWIAPFIPQQDAERGRATTQVPLLNDDIMLTRLKERCHRASVLRTWRPASAKRNANDGQGAKNAS